VANVIAPIQIPGVLLGLLQGGAQPAARLFD